jgi:hypothetical protein
MAVFNEMREQAKHLRLERLSNSTAPEFEAPGVQLAITELIDHAQPGSLVLIGTSF